MSLLAVNISARLVWRNTTVLASHLLDCGCNGREKKKIEFESSAETNLSSTLATHDLKSLLKDFTLNVSSLSFASVHETFL